MIALHSARSPVTVSGNSGSTRVATASLIQLSPLVIKVMASLLAMAPAARDKLMAAIAVVFFMVNESISAKFRRICMRIEYDPVLEGEMVHDILHAWWVYFLAFQCETCCCFSWISWNFSGTKTRRKTLNNCVSQLLSHYYIHPPPHK